MRQKRKYPLRAVGEVSYKHGAVVMTTSLMSAFELLQT